MTENKGTSTTNIIDMPFATNILQPTGFALVDDKTDILWQRIATKSTTPAEPLQLLRNIHHGSSLPAPFDLSPFPQGSSIGPFCIYPFSIRGKSKAPPARVQVVLCKHNQSPGVFLKPVLSATLSANIEFWFREKIT